MSESQNQSNNNAGSTSQVSHHQNTSELSNCPTQTSSAGAAGQHHVDRAHREITNLQRPCDIKPPFGMRRVSSM